MAGFSATRTVTFGAPATAAEVGSNTTMAEAPVFSHTA